MNQPDLPKNSFQYLFDPPLDLPSSEDIRALTPRWLVWLQISVSTASWIALTMVAVSILTRHADDTALVSQSMIAIVLLFIVTIVGVTAWITLRRLQRSLRLSLDVQSQRESALFASEQNLRSIMDNSALGFALVKPDFTLIAWNTLLGDVTRHLTGIELQVGMNAFNLVPERYRERLTTIFADVMQGRTHKGEFTLQPPPLRSLRSFESRYNPVRDEQGNVVAVCMVVEEITSRKHAETSLRQTEEVFRLIAENINEVFYVRDWRTDTYIYVSPAYEQVFQRSIDDLMKAPDDYIHAVHPEDLPELARVHELHKGKPYGYTVEYRILMPDGTIKWIWSRSVRVLDENGVVIRSVGIAEDVTRFKDAERQAVDLALERERMRLLSSFIRDVSHEFRTPLATIQSGLFLLKRTDDSTIRAERIARIEEQTRGILILVEDMVTITQLDSDPSLKFEQVQIETLLAVALDRVQPEAAAKRITLKVERPPDLTAVFADFNHLRLMLSNLLVNAVGYTPEDRIVRVSLRQQSTTHANGAGDRLIIDVQDGGDPIPADALPRLFDLFYRVDDINAAPSFGLGLPVVKRIAALLGGDVTVSSEPGRGSTFTITLPLHMFVMPD